MTDPPDDHGEIEFPVLSDNELRNLHRAVLGDALQEIARRQNVAETSYKSLTRKARREVLVAEYVCRAQKCLLLHVWNTPEGLCFYQPRFRLSPQVNESGSVESARRSRTSDGHRRWLPRWGSLDDLFTFCGDDPGLGADVNCDHFRGLLTGRRLEADVEGKSPGRPGKAVVLPDGDTPKGFAGAYDCPSV